MGNYRITYLDDGSNTRTIDLLPGDDGVRIEWRTELNRNLTSTGIHETVVQNTLRYMTFDCYFQEATFHKLESFMSFAQHGQPFTFTKDTDKGTQSTLAFSTPVDEIAIITTNTALDPVDFVAGDMVIIRDAFGTKWDVKEVDSIVNFDEFELTEGVYHAYSADAIVNWYYYFDSLLLLDDTFDPDRDGAFWHHTFNCVEVRSDS